MVALARIAAPEREDIGIYARELWDPVGLPSAPLRIVVPGDVAGLVAFCNVAA